MNRFSFVLVASFLFSNTKAQQDLAHKLSLEICKCLSAANIYTVAEYNKCFAYTFVKFQKEITQEYHLTSKSSYEESKAAGQKMRSRVEEDLKKNCPNAGRFKKK